MLFSVGFSDDGCIFVGSGSGIGGGGGIFFFSPPPENKSIKAY